MKNLLVFVLLALLIPRCRNAEPYRFKADDTLDLYVFDVPELSGEFIIDIDGFIQLPLIGKMSVAGLTESELLEELTSRIVPYYTEPKITVTPRFSVIMLGNVVNPNVYSISRGEHYLKVIAKAGGFGPEASRDIRIIRDGIAFTIDKDKLFYGTGELLEARAGDVIYARRKLLTRGDFMALISSMTALSLFIYYVSNNLK